MSENSPIQWTHHSFNPWWGCAEVSPGCAHCYARTDANRYAPRMTLWGPNSERRFFGDNYWRNPVKWNARCAKAGIRERVFCASMADVFDNHPGVGAARARLFQLIRETPNLDWLLLTKRIGNVRKMIEEAADWHFDNGDRNVCGWLTAWYREGISPANVWLGASIVNQEEADRDIPKLLATPARIRFLSCEPLLGPIDLLHIKREPSAFDRAMPGFSDCTGFYRDVLAGSQSVTTATHEYVSPAGSGKKIDWVICGGESGHGARSMNISWAVTILAECHSNGVPAFMKQLGARVNWDDNHPPRSIIHAKGGDIREWPEALQVREFPEVA